MTGNSSTDPKKEVAVEVEVVGSDPQKALVTINGDLAMKETDVPDVKVRELASSININDPSLTLTYGAETMSSISQFADALLDKVKSRDGGPVAESLSNLMLKVKDLDVDDLRQGKKGFLESLPMIGSLFASAERTIASYNTLAEQVDGIVIKLEGAMVGLMRDIEILEQLYQRNHTFYDDLSLYINAGKQKLAELNTVELPRMQSEVQADGNPMAAQNLRDFVDRIQRFERRLHDLELSRTITIQSAPQIRIIQGNNQALAEKIQASILSTIPIWKSQLVLALSLHGQRGAARLQKEVADTTNDMLRKNAEILQTSSIETAREVERSIVDIETLREVHGKLLHTIEETMRIADDAREKRGVAEKELYAMEQDLKQRLVAISESRTMKISAEGANAAITQGTTKK